MGNIIINNSVQKQLRDSNSKNMFHFTDGAHEFLSAILARLVNLFTRFSFFTFFQRFLISLELLAVVTQSFPWISEVIFCVAVSEGIGGENFCD